MNSIMEADGVLCSRVNGSGVTPETMEKVFNPFFTTRNTSHNDRLSLSLSYDIAREHGGDIRVESEPNEYTEMRVLLPVEPTPQREWEQQRTARLTIRASRSLH